MKSMKQFLKTTREVFRLYLKIAPGLTFGVTFTQILLSLQSVTYAYVYGLAIDMLIRTFENKTLDTAATTPIILLFVGLSLFSSYSDLVNSYFNGLLSNIDVSKLRLLQTDFLVSLGIAQMEDPELTNKSNRFTEVYSSMGQHLGLLINLLALLVSLGTYIVIVFKFSPILVVVLIVFFVVKYVNNGRFIKKAFLLRRNNTEKNRIAWNSIYYLGEPPSLKELLISQGMSLLRNKFNEYIEWMYFEYKKIRDRWFMFELGQTTIDSILYGVGLYFLIQKGFVEGFTIGTLTFYLRSLGSLVGQLDTLSYRFSRAVESSARLQDALELFEIYKPEKNGVIMLKSGVTPPSIELKGVSFKYPNGEKDVIKALNLTIKPGEKVAIVGENGAGKTTLVKLLTRIYKPQVGTVYVDDFDLNDVSKESWYKKIGVLFQDFNTYGHLSVQENVFIGDLSKAKKNSDIEESLRKADATKFVDGYPNKLNQLLSERFKGGIRPSGGQWQKIAIARFFYRNAPVLILDEPTASIDAVSEAQIFNNIYKFMKGKTVIIISHRFSTVRNADRILVLDKGKIIEDGSHEELMKLKGKYAHAFNLQAKGYS